MENEEYLKIIERWKIENKIDYENGKIRKVFLEILPHGGKSKNGGNIQNKSINWYCAINYKIYFIYKNIEGWVEIVNYEKNKKHYLTIKYNNNKDDVFSCDLQRCKIGKILGKVTGEFKIEIGTRYKDEKRDITISERRKDEKTSLKYYKYHCNKCGFKCGEHYSSRDKIYKEEYWITEGDLLKGIGCSCCSNHIVVENINSIVTMSPWMIEYFQNGYEEAKLYTSQSSQKIYPICPDCGKVKLKKMRINTIYSTHSIACICSDKFPYTEKFVFSVLTQLELDFQTQLNKTTFKWCKNYKYDFYFEFNNEQYMIETHGNQHYEDTSGIYIKTLEEEQENDRLKKELALANGIKEENYIVIDCRKSELEFIKNSILKNKKMNKHFDLSNIDWMKCGEFASCSLVKIACEYKKNNPDWTATQIGKSMGYCQRTIIDWLKQGSEIWSWINYNAKEEQIKNGKRLGNLKKGVINYV